MRRSFVRLVAPAFDPVIGDLRREEGGIFLRSQVAVEVTYVLVRLLAILIETVIGETTVSVRRAVVSVYPSITLDLGMEGGNNLRSLRCFNWMPKLG
jgi:hypothetical protein